MEPSPSPRGLGQTRTAPPAQIEEGVDLATDIKPPHYAGSFGAAESRTSPRMKNLLFAVLLACGLAPARGSVLELERMIQATTGRSALLTYSWYGCFCGIGGRGTPVDPTDLCCHAHDCCYRKLREGTCSPLITPYHFNVTDGDIVCGTEQSWCKRETCLCDRVVASCFASALPSYNNSYRFYFKLKCRGSSLQC